MVVLALDFDGVISDSAPEAFLVALRTYLEFFQNSTLDGVREEIERGPAGLLDAIRGSTTYAAFLEAMPLGNRAEDFGVVLRAIETGIAMEDQGAYNRFRDALSPEWLASFHRRFYETRSEWQARDPEAWATLLAPYPRLPALLRQWSSRVRLAIVTAKDRASVLRLLPRYGMEGLIGEDMLLDKETGVSKRAHLERLKDRLGCSYSEITFIDDKVNHLQDVADLGVRCVLSGWGYNGPREVEIARRAGYAVCELDTLEAQLGPRGP